MSEELTVTQRRVITVLERMINMVKEDENDADMFSIELDFMLNEIRLHDGFGTERQYDPRGDCRNGVCWTMDYVQGVDA